MEEVLSRFPHIGEGIFKQLNGKDFFKSLVVSQSWNFFIRNQRVLQKAYKVHKAIQERIQTLTEEIKDNVYCQYMKPTPFHLAAKRGYLALCQEIMENSDDKNPKDKVGWTPLHMAAATGHLSVCQLIVEAVHDKNPKDNYGWTPLHSAAVNGHMSVCQLIVENVDDKNPMDIYGKTPLDLATSYNHLGVKKIIEDAQSKGD